jgi:hypothetical protein
MAVTLDRRAVQQREREDRGRRERIARRLGIERDPESSESYSEELEAVMVEEVVAAEDQAGTIAEAAAAAAGAELGALRDHLVATHKDAIPELIAGETVGALLSSVEGARSAFQRAAAALVPSVPAGGGNREAGIAGLPPGVKIEQLDPMAKIALGLKHRNDAAQGR